MGIGQWCSSTGMATVGLAEGTCNGIWISDWVISTMTVKCGITSSHSAHSHYGRFTTKSPAGWLHAVLISCGWVLIWSMGLPLSWSVIFHCVEACARQWHWVEWPVWTVRQEHWHCFSLSLALRRDFLNTRGLVAILVSADIMMMFTCSVVFVSIYF